MEKLREESNLSFEEYQEMLNDAFLYCQENRGIADHRTNDHDVASDQDSDSGSDNRDDRPHSPRNYESDSQDDLDRAIALSLAQEQEEEELQRVLAESAQAHADRPS